MIARGGTASRFLAVLVLLSPLLAVGGAFTVWAVGRWVDGGQALAAAEQSRHEAKALTAQARLYAPLREVWGEHAASEASGLALEGSAAGAASVFEARLGAAFKAAGGALRSLERLEDGPPPRAGLQMLRFEALGGVRQGAAPQLLAAIEQARPYAFIDFLDMALAPGGGRAAPADRAVTLRLRLSLYRIADHAAGGEGRR